MVQQARGIWAVLQCMAAVGAGIVLGLFAYSDAFASAPDYLAELQLASTPEDFAAGQVHQVIVKVANQGKQPWPSLGDDPSYAVRLSYHWLDVDGGVVIFDGLRTELQRAVGPGEGIIVRASVLSPDAPGTYTLVLDLIREQVTWFAAQGSPPLMVSPIEVRRVGWVTWQRGRILLIAAGTLFLLFVMGFGVAGLLCPNFPRALTPVVGVATITTLSYCASLLGISMQCAKWEIIVLGVGLAILTLALRRRFSRPRQRRSVFPIGLTLMMSCLALFPLWEFGRPSAVRNTYAAYVVIMSEYWKSHTLYEVPKLDPYQPLDYLVRERLLQGYVDGGPFLNAFVASTFALNSYETYSILTALLLALLPMTLYWVARSAFGLGPWASRLAVLLIPFNATYFSWSVAGQLPFIAGLLFLPLAVGAGAVLFEGRGSLLAAALFLSTLVAVYPPLLAFVLVPLLSYGGLQVWRKALSREAFGLTILQLLVCSVLMNPVILYTLVLFGTRMAGQISENWGNLPGYPSIAELLGLLPHLSHADVGLPFGLLAFGLVPVFVGITGCGFYQAWKDGRWLLIATTVPYLLGALGIVLVMNYSYGYYKHGVVTLFAFLFAFSYGLEALWKKGRAWGKLLLVLYGGAFFFSSLLAFRALLWVTPPSFIPPELASLSAVKKLSETAHIIFIDENDISLQLWTSYFLWGVPLSVPPAFEPWGWWGFSSVFGRGDPLRFYHPHAAYTLAKWGEIARPRPEPIWSNALYVVHPGPPVLSLGQGWYALEEGSAPFRWMAGEGTLRLRGDRLPRRPIRLRIVPVPISAPLTLEVSLQGRELGAFTARYTSHPAVSLTIPFSMDEEAAITIRSVQGCFEPARLGGSDVRCLSARFQDITLIEVEE